MFCIGPAQKLFLIVNLFILNVLAQDILLNFKQASGLEFFAVMGSNSVTVTAANAPCYIYV